jgi:hypothetical protein
MKKLQVTFIKIWMKYCILKNEKRKYLQDSKLNIKDIYITYVFMVIYLFFKICF